MGARIVYDEMKLRSATSGSKSWRSVAKALGYKTNNGITVASIRKRCLELGVDFAHLDAAWEMPSRKICLSCAVEKDLDDFAIKSANRDGRQPYCKGCQREKVKTHYEANVPYYVAKAKRAKTASTDKVREWLLIHLLANPCVDCGDTDIRGLTFDHVRGVKTSNVSHLVRGGYSLEVVISEVAKCDVRCASCHMKKTARDFGWWTDEYMQSIAKVDVIGQA